LKYESAILPNYKKVNPTSLGFPFIILDEKSEVIGELYYDIDEELLNSIDAIEGEGSLYHRIIVEVLNENAERIQAYTYYPSDKLIKKFT
jgi:gamma-glutamylcyclotransferase (GGCT)/AIG2-like uncharacterized protein YtfP